MGASSRPLWESGTAYSILGRNRYDVLGTPRSRESGESVDDLLDLLFGRLLSTDCPV